MKTLLFILTFSFILIESGSFAQTKIVQGQLYDKETDAPIEGAKIIRSDTLLSATSLNSGKFAIVLPVDYRQTLIISHPDYEVFSIDVKPYMELQEVNIGLVFTNTRSGDISRNVSSPVLYKNNLTLAPVELIFSTITLSYERFLQKQQSVGLYVSVYINRGKNIFFYNNPDRTFGNHTLNGFKIAPYYRYYLKNKTHFGPFIQAKAIVGYFHLEDNYSSYYEDFDSGDFWSLGAGFAFGVKIRHKKFKRHTLEFSVGVRYLPITNPSVEDYFYGEIPTPGGNEISSWYFASPGSIVDLKFILGGIF